MLSHFSRVQLCDPIDGSPWGSPVPGILQARTLEWVAISFSNTWKWKWKGSHSVVSNPQRPHGPQPTRLPPSVGFSRQEYWSGVPLLALLKMTHLSTYQKGFVVPEQVTLQAPQSIASYGMGHNPGFNVPQPVKHFKENRGFEKPESLRFGFSFAQQIHIWCLWYPGHYARHWEYNGSAHGPPHFQELTDKWYWQKVNWWLCCVLCLVTQSCQTLCDPMNCSLPSTSVHGDRQQYWSRLPSSRRSLQPRDQTQVSHIAGGFFTAVSHQGNPD